jgi:methylenetetrahydrofolate dehydrogenase (NADP+)/methenyltetrahydrofolate cyclohydrolase
LKLIDELNRSRDVHGILVQLPLPPQIDTRKVIEAIDPAKDVDGFHPINVGRLSAGEPALVPCTPAGCIILAKSVQPDLRGLEAVVIGRSNIVGKPVAQLLLREDCTVTIAHSRTRDLPSVVRRADLVIAAVGRPEMVRGDWIKPGAIVIDVGINRVEGADGKARLVGDVAFGEAVEVAGAITPVPGGVGPMTIACLLKNTVEAARSPEVLPKR